MHALRPMSSASRRWRVTAAFVLLAITQMPQAPGAVPLYVVTVGAGAVIANVRRYSHRPLLRGEPWWRKFLLTLAHGRRVRETALREAPAPHSTRVSEDVP
ncbi:hypothetical protein GCM10027024_15950 [Microbacterium insulae]